MDKVLIWTVIFLFIPIVVMVIGQLWKGLMNYICAIDTPTAHNYWVGQRKGTQTVVHETGSKRRILGRKHPPRATFFSKVNGKEKQVDGPYEEQWLNSVEKWNWRVRGKKYD